MTVQKTSSTGKRIKVHVSGRKSADDAAYDARLQEAVREKVARQLSSGTPVARYNIKTKKIYMEYPDGHIEERT